MATQLQFRRGTTAQTIIFTGATGEVTVDTTKGVVVVHDGTTVGGIPSVTEAFARSSANTANNSYATANAAFTSANVALTYTNTFLLMGA
jgi:hypothetical protein